MLSSRAQQTGGASRIRACAARPPPSVVASAIVMMEFGHAVGRIATVRFLAPLTEDEVFALGFKARSLFTQVARPAVFCTDVRAAGVLPTGVAERLIQMMRADNPGVERNALLVGDGSLLALQFDRMLREAAHPGRRTFRDPGAAITWLSEVLDLHEQAALRTFLSR